MDKSITKELILRNILWTAKRKSYYNPKKDKRLDYEANNAFSRLIISFLSFVHKGNDPFFVINMKDPMARQFIKKWELEMKEKGIKPDSKSLIKIINTYTPKPESIIDPNIDVKKVITKKTLDRMKYKFQGEEYDFEKIVTIVYLRYKTYNAWSQCWTVTDQDRVNFKNKNWKNIELFGSSFNTQKDTYLFGTLFPDIDYYFGGINRYRDLYQKIIKDNKNGIFYNIQISPPNVEMILEDLIPMAVKLRGENNVLCMFPTWQDSIAYIKLSELFDNSKRIYKYSDMFFDKIIEKGDSTLFYDNKIK